jgi:plasmid stability protein
MAAITIRRLDDSVKERLRIRAARHKRSMEEEAREILKASVAEEEVNWVDAMRARFIRIGGVDLPVPPRSELATDRSIFEDFGPDE